MMLPFSKPRRVVSQAPLKSTLCVGGCGSTVVYRTNSRKFCEVCGPERVLARARLSATKQRRRRGIAPVKGTEALCDRCGRSIIRSSIKHRFCAECSPIATLDYSREYQRRKYRAQGREPVGIEKTCTHCFASFIKAKKGRQSYCDACQELQSRNQLPHLKEARRAYLQNVLKPRYQSDAEYRAHTRKLAAQSRARRKRNPAFTINERMSAAIRGCLNGGKNGNSWEALVGYTLIELMRHLERQFVEGMTWDNRGLWEIDHVVPLSSFKFTSTQDTEFRRCWVLTNLRPLWKEQNNAKRAIRTHLL